jgi:hypothetical protein
MARTGQISKTSVPESGIVAKGLEMVARQNLKMERNPVIWTLSQYAQEGFGSSGVFIGYKAIKSHLRNLTRGDPTATNRVISVMSKLVASCTEIISSLTSSRLKSESIRQNFDVDQQAAYLRSHGAKSFLQKLQDIMSEPPHSSMAIDRASPALTVPEPAQASSSTNIDSIAPKPLVSTPLGLGHHDSVTTREQPPKKDLLARKLDQLSDSSASSTEVREKIELATLILSLCFGIHSISKWTLTRSARRVLGQIR